MSVKKQLQLTIQAASSAKGGLFFMGKLKTMNYSTEPFL